MASKIKMIGDLFVSRFMPTKFIDEMLTWKTHSKSPYSDSHYNCEGKSWNYTPEGSIRISDHWNFDSNGKIHCKTNIDVPNNTHYAKCVYNNGIYTVLEVLPLNSEELQAYEIELKEEEERDRLMLIEFEKEREIRKNTYRVELNGIIQSLYKDVINEMIENGTTLYAICDYKKVVIDKVGSGYVFYGNKSNISHLLTDKA